MTKTRAPQVRTELNAIINDMPADGLTVAEIVQILRRTKDRIVKAEIDDLIEIALAVIASGVLKWRSGPKSSSQIELFKEYDLPRTYTLRQTGQAPIHKKLRDMTYADARLYIAQHDRPQAISPDVAEVARFLELADSVSAEPEEKLLDIWDRANGSGAGSGSGAA